MELLLEEIGHVTRHEIHIAAVVNRFAAFIAVASTGIAAA